MGFPLHLGPGDSVDSRAGVRGFLLEPPRCSGDNGSNAHIADSDSCTAEARQWPFCFLGHRPLEFARPQSYHLVLEPETDHHRPSILGWFSKFWVLCPFGLLSCGPSGPNMQAALRLTEPGTHQEYLYIGTPLQYSCLENPMDRGAWQAAVHGVAKSWTRLSDFTFTFFLSFAHPVMFGYLA